MDIILEPVTRQNFAGVIDLKVTPGQESFVAPNLTSLAEAYIEPGWTPLAIRTGETVVGFAIVGQHEESGRWCSFRFMIGAEHQGKGFGTAALSGLIERMVERHTPRAIFLGYEPGNAIAERLYGRFGVVPTGETVAGEIIARLDVG